MSVGSTTKAGAPWVKACTTQGNTKGAVMALTARTRDADIGAGAGASHRTQNIADAPR